MSGTYNGTYTSIVKLSSSFTDVTIGTMGVINAYGLGGTYPVYNNGSITLTPIYGALFGPRGTVFTVTNQGLIETHGTDTTSGFDVGIGLGTPGTVLNEGTILGATGIGILDATTTGLAGYVNNSGQITGSIGNGIYLDKGSITNSGHITGYNGGLQIGGTGQVTNVAGGTIASTGTKGAAVALSSSGVVLNSGLLTSKYVGVGLYSAATVINSGTIEQTGSVGSNASYAGGIVMQQGGTVTNAVHGLITGAHGIIDSGTSGYVYNAGSINAGKAVGVYFLNTGTVVNHGSITGAHRAIVDFDATGPGAGTGVVLNFGLLQSSADTFNSNGTIKTGFAVVMHGAESLTNYGTGEIIGAGGVYLNGGGASVSLDNQGAIEGTYKDGIVLDSSGSITNTGSVSGTNAGIYSDSTGVTISNDANAVVSATDAAGIALHAGGTVLDAGTIDGGVGHDAIYFGAGSARLVIEAGASLSGGVSAVSSTSATLELGSAAVQATFDMGGTVGGFGAITFDSGQDWSLEGSLSELGSSIASISGFASGDTILLDGFTAVSASFNSGQSVLDLTNAGGTVAQLTMLGPYGADEFQIADVGQGTEVTLCFARGTRIFTPAGERAVEELRPGDAVVSWRSGIAWLKWIGYQSFAGPFLARNPERLPVRILAGALGEDMPRRDLAVSPGHAVLLNGTLVLAQDLVNGITVLQDEAPELVEYFALELDRHDCVLADGVFAESFADGPGLRNQFHNLADFHARFADYEEPAALDLCAPRPQAGAALEDMVRPVAARAAALITPGRVRGFIDILDAGGHVEGWAQDLAHPELPVLLEIRIDDQPVGTCLACHYRDDLRRAGIGKGRAKFSFDVPPGGTITVHCAADGSQLPLTDDCQMQRAG